MCKNWLFILEKVNFPPLHPPQKMAPPLCIAKQVYFLTTKGPPAPLPSES